MGKQTYLLESQSLKCEVQSSHHGSVETYLTSIHEDTGLIPGLAQWVKDLALPQMRLGSGISVAMV